MIKVFVSKQLNYPISTPKIKKHVKNILVKKGLVSDASISVALIGIGKMKQLSLRYLKEVDGIHNVLSFTENEVSKKFIYPPGNAIHLGEVVVCYPLAVEEAKKLNQRIDKRALFLIEHGISHLLGEHHD